MTETDCYSKLSSVYHLIFDDWEGVIKKQARILSAILPSPHVLGPVLDCSCGIGTQTFALATLGYKVEGSDLSDKAIERAKMEANIRGFQIDFRLDDMRLLKTAPSCHYGAMISMDNSLPHLNSDEEIIAALTAMRNCLKKKGILLLSIRDYGRLIKERPTSTTPNFFQDDTNRRFYHQVWDWQDERRYKVHFYISYETFEGWKVHHSVGQYRAVTEDELVCLAQEAGFNDVEIRLPAETGFYQPIILATAP